MKTYLLETKNLSKAFKGQEVVKQVSLQVEENTIYGLLGPNGAGKSTTLKMLIGLLKPTSGDILFEGQPWKREHLQSIGALIESPSLYPNLTAKENLQVYATLLSLSSERIEEVLAIVGLSLTGKKKSGEFSMGMKQRLGIAIALLANPKLVILDEPTNGLDPIGIKELRQLIKSFPEQGITVIISSHNLTEIGHIVDTIGIINDGRLLYQGPKEEGQDMENLFMSVVGGDI